MIFEQFLSCLSNRENKATFFYSTGFALSFCKIISHLFKVVEWYEFQKTNGQRTREIPNLNLTVKLNL